MPLHVSPTFPKVPSDTTLIAVVYQMRRKPVLLYSSDG